MLEHLHIEYVYMYLNICLNLNKWMVNNGSYKPQKIKHVKQNLKKIRKLQMALKMTSNDTVHSSLRIYSR